MSYIRKNLMQAEQVVYESKVHWFIFIGPALWLTFGGLLWAIAEADTSAVDPEAAALIAVSATVMILFGAIRFLQAFLTRLTTEFGVTNKRVIAKQGWIRRDTTEINHSKVESFAVDQSILGRVFGFGTVTVQGTGGGQTPIQNIDDPMKLRREAVQIIDQA